MDIHITLWVNSGVFFSEKNDFFLYINLVWVLLHEYIKYVQKVSRLKLYLPRKKWIMNETLIFLQIQGVYKMYWDWTCIDESRNWQGMKC